MEDENSITEEEINKALRAVMDMAIIPMIAGSSFKIKEFNSC
jgi:elongation factor G